jgi:hypothetical protein
VYVIVDGGVDVDAFHDKETVPPSAVNATKFVGCVGEDIVLLYYYILI